MALNPGTRRLLWSAASWGVVALIAVAAVTHLGQLRSAPSGCSGRADRYGCAAGRRRR